MKNNILFVLLFGLAACFITNGQKVNTDSLLMEGLKSFKAQKYDKAIEQGRLGVKLAPEYTDFHMLLGRSFVKKGKTESAKFYFAHVMATAPEYKDAFINAINLENSTKDYGKSLSLLETANTYFKEDKDLELLQLKTLQLQDEPEALLTYLKELIAKYPENNNFLQILRKEQSKFISDRIGIDHNHSIFNREGTGPWNLTGMQYIRERRKTTFIGRVNYTDRRSNGSSLRSGYQFELGSFIKTGVNGTSITNIAFSEDVVFPNLRLSHSYLHNFDTGWELDAGGRYIKPNAEKDIYAAAIGVGKYIGSSWLNVSSFLFFDEGENYVSIGGTYRYYFNTKFDFFAILAGYGSSPDESLNLTPFTDQVSLNSYRIGIAFNKVLGNKLIVGVQVFANQQEYVKNKMQNQFNFFTSLQYKL